MAWSRDFGVIERRFNVAPERLMNCLERQIKAALEYGQDLMQDTVESSGTEFSHSQGRRGRVVTGETRDNIDTEVGREGMTVRGSVGWLEGTPYYARFQELGFMHHLSGELVEGMMAIAEAREEVWIEFRQGAEQCLKESIVG